MQTTVNNQLPSQHNVQMLHILIVMGHILGSIYSGNIMCQTGAIQAGNPICDAFDDYHLSYKLGYREIYLFAKFDIPTYNHP